MSDKKTTLSTASITSIEDDPQMGNVDVTVTAEIVMSSGQYIQNKPLAFSCVSADEDDESCGLDHVSGNTYRGKIEGARDDYTYVYLKVNRIDGSMPPNPINPPLEDRESRS